MLKQRVITALIGLPLLLGTLAWAPEWAVALMFLGCVGIASYEIAAMMLPRLEAVFNLQHRDSGALRVKIPAYSVWFCVFIACTVFTVSVSHSPIAGRGILIVSVLSTILMGAFLSPDNNIAMGRILGYTISLSYGVLPWLAIWELYLLGDDARYVFLLLAIVWSGDTGAYFGGRWLGKRKLAPRMSPKKTWAGAVVGIFASLLGGLILNLLYGVSLGSWYVIVVSCVSGGIAGQMGDLVESTFKRFAGVKDSGALIPGHGGFLDRTDGLLFAAPILWFMLHTFG